MIDSIDLFVFNIFHGLAGTHWSLDWLYIFLADYLGYFMVLAALVTAFLLKENKERLTFIFFTILSLLFSRGLITEIIRFFYYRPRPFLALNFEPLVNHDAASSFPSGHAAFYFALALAVFYFNKKAGKWLIGAAVLMGFARVIAGAHWPLDILAGAVVGLGGTYMVARLLRIVGGGKV